MAANPVRQAIYSLLAADSTLIGLLAAQSAIYHQQAPRLAATPYVVFSKQSGTPAWMYGGADTQSDLWLIKAVDRSPSSTTAETVAARLDALLKDAALAVSGRTTLWMRRDSDIQYPEQDGADVFQHCGSVWRLLTTS